MPIAGEEFLFEMTTNCLLPPNARGVPQWVSDQTGEKLMMKLPRQFQDLFSDGRALDEKHGQALARWARGTPNAGGTEPREGSAAPLDTEKPPAASKKLSAQQWADQAVAEIVRLKTTEAVSAWVATNQARLDKMATANVTIANKLQDIINEQMDACNVLAAG